MKDVLLQALMVRTREGLAVIPLRDHYRFGDPTPEQRVEVSQGGSDLQESVRITLDSVTLVYGENGGGKTQLLLDLALTLSRQKGERRIGIFWRDAVSRELCFDPGSRFRSVVFSGQVPVRERSFDGRRKGLATLFYTTSPFESSRRRALKMPGLIDATPSFGSDNPFNGTALLRVAHTLPTDLDFIGSTRVGVRVRFPSLRSLMEEFTATSDREVEPKYAKIDDAQRRYLRKLPDLIDGRRARWLTIEMLGALRDGEDEVRRLLLEMAAGYPLTGQAPFSPERDFDPRQAATMVDRLLGQGQVSDPPTFGSLLSAKPLSLSGGVAFQLDSFVRPVQFWRQDRGRPHRYGAALSYGT